MGTEDLPEEIRLETRNGNFVRAAHLAVQYGVARDRVRELQCKAVRQFIEELHNFEGAKKLISEYDLSLEEVRTILQNVLESPRTHTEQRTCFDSKKGRMIAKTLAQRIREDPMFRNYLRGTRFPVGPSVRST
jgi:hypothetical protein